MTLLSSRNLLIVFTIFLVSSPQIFQFFLKLNYVIQKSGVRIPYKEGDYYVIPGGPAIDEKSLGPKIRVAVCATDQFKRTAQEIRQILEHNFPMAEVIVEPLLPSEGRVFGTQILSALQGFFIMLTLVGASIMTSFGVDPAPVLIEWLSNHRILSIALIWVVGNFLTQTLLNTGAFEVFCDGKLIFSRLAEGVLPGMKLIVDGIRKVLPDDSD